MSEYFNHKLPVLLAAASIGISLPSLATAESLQSLQPEAKIKPRDPVSFTKIGAFTLQNRKVAVFDQKDFEAKGSYSFGNLEEASRSADRVAKLKIVLPFSMVDANSRASIPLPVNVSRSEGTHVFKVTRDPSTLIRASEAQDPPSLDVGGYTQFDPLNREVNTTFLTQPKQEYDRGLRRDTLGINTENCNNLINLKFSSTAYNNVRVITKNEPSRLRALYGLAYETVCNSYGFLVADKEAGQTYNQYKKTSQHKSLRYVPGLILPLVTFPKKAWDAIDIKTRH